ncbi:Rhomboid family protein [Streptomyces sp. 2224.1]|uniref:rhomboid family intramembrane serine protease n=1 Tax=unclassified Streptomyces TaxID=2593676 RepID=UPI00087F5C22|nr:MULTISPECIES: rhomboid family intramembrane serine protease [unclassified Streptomyces]PBC83250.1 rhomboid family protein [Streptomyces sp. 2321.6]SDR43930.1 Rhomboid family protein [Streptomyces sp. KS_16]SEC13382.1 Rhomboid family protein [Streptomyces sp. 2224.1]SEC89848.1 Rhomboid family protein [Streptomyces sp. 2133.1]SEE82576.1 Rhomboid family protein [Streptomyces sp. 2112.3]
MRSRAKPALCLMLGWVALLWLLEGVDVATGGSLDAFGIQPREPAELLDVVPAAFLHFGFAHLAANTLPLLLLGFVAALRSGVRRLLAVVLLIILASGLGVWLTAAPDSNTAGASGVVFGLFGYLLVRGFIERSALDIGIGLVIGVLYGSILWGALPSDNGISWQGHLFGLIGGVLAAFVFRERLRGDDLAGAGVRPVT